MKYNIGDIVKYYKDSENNYIILATREKPLDTEHLKSLKGKLNIDRIEEFAKVGITVFKGFDYKVFALRSFKDKIVEINEDSINILEDDIYR